MSDELVACPVCLGSGGGPGDKVNPLGGCSWCEGAGVVPASEVAAIVATARPTTLHKGRNWWLMERGSTGFDSKAHGGYSSRTAALEAAAAMRLTIVEETDANATV